MTGGGYHSSVETSASVHGLVYGSLLYSHISEHIGKYMEGVAERARQHTGDDLLVFYNKEWVKYGDSAKVIHNIFSYLNRHWIQREQEEGRNVSDVNALMFNLWLDRFFMEIRSDLLDAVFSLMRRVRDGQVADLNIVKSVTESFVTLGTDDAGVMNKKMDVYNSHFLKPFLKATAKYYTEESTRLLQSGTIVEYIVRVAERFNQEEEWATQYMHAESMPEFNQCLTNTMVRDQKDKLNAEFRPMLEGHQTENLRRLYDLVKRLSDKVGLDPLRVIFTDFVKHTGQESIKQVSANIAAAKAAAKEAAAKAAATPGSAPAAANAAAAAAAAAPPSEARLFVAAVLDIHDKYAALLHESFSDDPGFGKSLDSACSNFINANELCPKDESRASILLAQYCDMLLKKGNSTVRTAGAEGASEEDNLENQLSQAICVFKYITDADVFQKFYSQSLSRRLVHEQSASMHAEQTMISKLKEVSGTEFTVKLSRMFTDMAVSKDAIEVFKSQRKSPAPLPFDFDMKVLNASSWPLHQPDTKLRLPPVLQDVSDEYSAYYGGQHNGRKLRWLWQHSRAEIKMFFPKATGPAAKTGYIFQVTTYQLAILMLFTEKEGALTFGDIVKETQLNEDLVKAELEMFCKARVLLSSNNKVDQQSSKFTLNLGYKSKRLRINFSMAKKPEKKKEEKENMEAVDVGRRHTIDAAIVRVMKARKQLNHRQLVENTISQIKLFHAQVSDIKKAIDSLIDREYLQRDGEQRDVYNYLA